MLSAIAIVPSAPVLVPELAGGAAELTELRDAVFTAVGELPPRWVAIGVADADTVVGPQVTGTFAGYGVDVRVTLAPGVDTAPVPLPLCALIAGWVRGATDASVEVRTYAADHAADAAVQQGRRLRALIDEAADPIGVLVIGDGLNTLTPSAPGGHDPDSVPVQTALDAALAGGDAAALTRLPDTVLGRVAYHVLAGLAPAPRSTSELYRGAPYGVGYFVGVWTP